MRLSEREVDAIRKSACEAFGSDAVVRVFGSRLDDTRRGGDIDLHVQVSPARPADARARFRRLLDQRVGEREYDIVVLETGHPTSAIDRKALSEGEIL